MNGRSPAREGKNNASSMADDTVESGEEFKNYVSKEILDRVYEREESDPGV